MEDVVDRGRVRELILEALAECHGAEELAGALAASLDDYLFELDSKTAEYVLVFVEGELGIALPSPADLGPDVTASVGSLLDAIFAHLGVRAA